MRRTLLLLGIAAALLAVAAGCPRHTTTDNPQHVDQPAKACYSPPADSTPAPYPHAWEVCAHS